MTTTVIGNPIPRNVQIIQRLYWLGFLASPTRCSCGLYAMCAGGQCLSAVTPRLFCLYVVSEKVAATARLHQKSPLPVGVESIPGLFDGSAACPMAGYATFICVVYSWPLALSRLSRRTMTTVGSNF